MACLFCNEPGGEILWQDAACRAIWAPDADYPALCRVVWNQHIKEMHDLAPARRIHLMRVVFAVEAALMQLLQPAKMNLASLGNQVPHLHWHVVPRFADDPHFPGAIWGTKLREGKHGVHPAFADDMRRLIDDALKGSTSD